MINSTLFRNHVTLNAIFVKKSTDVGPILVSHVIKYAFLKPAHAL